MNRGYVHLWRKSLDSGWIKNHKLWVFWTWCLLKASYKEHDVVFGNQTIHLMPGQFIFGRMAAVRETGLTEQEVRTILAFLRKSKSITIKPTNKYSIITLINWQPYQRSNLSGQPSDQPTINQQITTYNKGNKGNKKNPENFSSQISSLREKYPQDFQKAIDEILAAISSTRKFGKMADSVKLKILEGWKTFPSDQVMTGCRIYLEKAYHLEGKDEKYLLGIIRKQKAQTGETSSPEKTPPVRRTFQPLICPACKRSVLPSEMSGDVCISCTKEKPHV